MSSSPVYDPHVSKTNKWADKMAQWCSAMASSMPMFSFLSPREAEMGALPGVEGWLGRHGEAVHMCTRTCVSTQQCAQCSTCEGRHTLVGACTFSLSYLSDSGHFGCFYKTKWLLCIMPFHTQCIYLRRPRAAVPFCSLEWNLWVQ